MEKEEMKVLNISGIEYKYNAVTHYEKDNHVFCRTCHKQVDGDVVALMGRKIILYRDCDCKIKEKEEQKKRERQFKVDELKKNAFSNKAQLNYTFKNADEHTDKALIKKLENYVENFEEFIKDNIGLLIYGSVGSGKTYLSCAIANEIMEKYLYSAKVINFAQILNDLQKGGFDLDRNEYIEMLTNKTLLVIDDFGIERNTEYALEQVYNVINARYQKQKPTIITTNLDYKMIESETDNIMLNRIYSRIIEMCLPIKVVTEDRRKEKRNLKIDKAMKLINK